jgi:hypothetical protein
LQRLVPVILPISSGFLESMDIAAGRLHHQDTKDTKEHQEIEKELRLNQILGAT